jgi:hypothetical protein
MTAAARAYPAARPSTREIFVARTEARAALWQFGELSLHEAVDKLQADAVRDGLVTELGQDEVQRLMAEAFGAVREDLPKFGDIFEPEIVEIAEVVPDPMPESTFEPLENPASDSTVEAVVYALREYGTDALHRGNSRARLAELSNRQIEVVIARLARMSSKYSTVSERLLLALAELLP